MIHDFRVIAFALLGCAFVHKTLFSCRRASYFRSILVCAVRRQALHYNAETSIYGITINTTSLALLQLVVGIQQQTAPWVSRLNWIRPNFRVSCHLHQSSGVSAGTIIACAENTKCVNFSSYRHRLCGKYQVCHFARNVAIERCRFHVRIRASSLSWSVLI